MMAPSMEPSRRMEAGGGDDGPVDGSGDGGRQEAGMMAPSLDPAMKGGKRWGSRPSRWIRRQKDGGGGGGSVAGQSRRRGLPRSG